MDKRYTKMKRLLLLLPLILFFNIFGKAFCQTSEELKETLNVFSQNESVRPERSIPKKLESIGESIHFLVEIGKTPIFILYSHLN